jgi:hypothetical protein
LMNHSIPYLKKPIKKKLRVGSSKQSSARGN